VQDLDLLVAHVVRGEGDRRLHAQQAEQLEHVVLDQVAQGARAVVVARARPDAQVLGRGDLHVVDVVAVPQRLEHAVGEAERQQVLDGLLAEVVVDAEELVLVEDRQHVAVEVERLRERRSERLLDHAPHLAPLERGESRLPELAHDDREEARRGRQVEDAVQRLRGRGVVLLQNAAQRRVGLGVVELARHVARVVEQDLQDRRIHRAPAEAVDRRLALGAELLVAERAARDADDVEADRQAALVREVVERREQLALGQVPRGPEDDERRRMDGDVLERHVERIGPCR